MNNLSSYCGLVDARISASEKDLPVWYKSMDIRENEMSVYCWVLLSLCVMFNRNSSEFFLLVKDVSVYKSCGESWTTAIVFLNSNIIIKAVYKKRQLLNLVLKIRLQFQKHQTISNQT